MERHNKLAMVTGGSGGIGLELAKQFADHGFDVAISGQSDRVYESAEELRAKGVEAYPYQADASTYDGVEGFWRFVEDLGRPVDAAALNVGIGLGGAFIDNDLEDEFRLIAINITGLVHMAKRVARHMTANGGGRILITSSISATKPTPYETTYRPSKAFGFSFAESLREELRGGGGLGDRAATRGNRQRLPRQRRDGEHHLRRQQLEERQDRGRAAGLRGADERRRSRRGRRRGHQAGSHRQSDDPRAGEGREAGRAYPA